MDAVSNAIKNYFGIDYVLTVYEEHAISQGSSSKAAAYVGIVAGDRFYWGVGVDEDIIKSSIAALVSAANKLTKEQHIREGREERIVEILSHIQQHYKQVTLDSLAEDFHLSKPFLSKFIREKAGNTNCIECFPGGQNRVVSYTYQLIRIAQKGDFIYKAFIVI